MEELLAKVGPMFTKKLLKPSAISFLSLAVVSFTLKNSGKEIVASELKDPICHSNECQIGSFSSEAAKCAVLFLITLLIIFQVPFTSFLCFCNNLEH